MRLRPYILGLVQDREGFGLSRPSDSFASDSQASDSFGLGHVKMPRRMPRGIFCLHGLAEYRGVTIVPQASGPPSFMRGAGLGSSDFLGKLSPTRSGADIHVGGGPCFMPTGGDP
ncbi:hypothetical protein Adt_42232 [Abeliophyllum distichum]|uniref:Uncharacterized protein n=1 Tax=Abeliophyllum distichum TaxID=126358 RepID=A0ABD1PR36_9LAMI